VARACAASLAGGPAAADFAQSSGDPDVPDSCAHIAGAWRPASTGETLPVLNPATAEPIGELPVASRDDLDQALEAAKRGFKAWRTVSAYDRSKVMRKAADLLRERADAITKILTLEQGKPLVEAKLEVMNGADTIDWFAEEGRRAYGRVVPGRAEGVMQIVTKEPVGPVAAFTPWNFRSTRRCRKSRRRSARAARSCSRGRKTRRRAASS
jgi:succinate-semialdehyde dehydrogenase/glutarate-semialdehyde dehydrogenase